MERGILQLECASLAVLIVRIERTVSYCAEFCACVGLWFIERGILHLECAFLGFFACVGLWFIERGILHLECVFLGFCEGKLIVLTLTTATDNIYCNSTLNNVRVSV